MIEGEGLWGWGELGAWEQVPGTISSPQALLLSTSTLQFGLHIAF